MTRRHNLRRTNDRRSYRAWPPARRRSRPLAGRRDPQPAAGGGRLDGEGTENFILPAQLCGMAVLGGVVGYLLPGLAGDGASTRRAVWVGVGVALLLAVLGVVFFFLLLNGFDGA